MVIGPQEVLKPSGEESRWLNNLEGRLDGYIPAYIRFDDHGIGSVDFVLDEKAKAIRERVLEGLLEQYRNKGWDVKRIYEGNNTVIRFVYDPKEQRNIS